MLGKPDLKSVKLILVSNKRVNFKKSVHNTTLNVKCRKQIELSH